MRYDVSYRLSEAARSVKNELKTRLVSTADAMKEAVNAGISSRDRSQAEQQRLISEMVELRERVDQLWAHLTTIQQKL